MLHFILTTPIVLWARFNFPIRQITARNSTDILEFIDLIDRIVYIVLLLFFIGQVIFAFLLFKTRKEKQTISNVIPHSSE